MRNLTLQNQSLELCFSISLLKHSVNFLLSLKLLKLIVSLAKAYNPNKAHVKDQSQESKDT